MMGFAFVLILMLLLLKCTFGGEDKRGKWELILDVGQPLITSVLFVTSQKVDFSCSFLCCLFFLFFC